MKKDKKHSVYIYQLFTSVDDCCEGVGCKVQVLEELGDKLTVENGAGTINELVLP